MADYPDFTYRGDVDIIAQSVALLAAQIDILSQSVGIYLQPEWAALQAIDKTLLASGTTKGFHQFASVTYTPTAPKALYITAIGFNSQIENAADYDHPAHVQVAIFVGGSVALTIGGESGGAIVLPKPIVVDGGVQLIGTVLNNSNIDCAISATIMGYEV